MATSVVLLAMLVLKFTGLNVDGWCGAMVALFILYAGYSAAKDTLSPLLGQPPEEELISQIRDITLSHQEIVGIHDLVVHDYGPGRLMISLHGEVPGDGNIFELHDVIDQAEKELKDKLGCDAVIHMDPIATDDEEVNITRRSVAELCKDIHEDLS
ncbi:MAG: cation diffusion facilitator family transporter, partial [Eisenbergiella sp.]